MANNVLLNNTDHRDLRVHNRYAPELGDNVMYTPTFAREFKTIQAHYPIVFQKQAQGDTFIPLALLGLENHENLFLTDRGWDASYVPLMMQRLPFSIGFHNDSLSRRQTRVLHIDLDHPKISHDESGQRLFRDDGSTTEYLERISGLLEAIHQAHADDRAFTAKLIELDLLEPVNLKIRLADGAEGQLTGFYTVNEQKLAELPSSPLNELHHQGWLEPIFMVIASLPKLQNLVDRKSQRLVP